MKLVLLPGLDGIGLLFEPLLRVLPSSFSPIVISYPPEEPLAYAELVPYVKSRIPANDVKRRSLTEMKSIKATMEVVEIDGPHLLLQRKPEECLAAMNRFISRCL
jgi:hypothetical protein